MNDLYRAVLGLALGSCLLFAGCIQGSHDKQSSGRNDVMYNASSTGTAVSQSEEKDCNCGKGKNSKREITL